MNQIMAAPPIDDTGSGSLPVEFIIVGVLVFIVLWFFLGRG